MKFDKTLSVALLIALSLPVFINYASIASSADFTDTEKAYAFLTDVVQLDLSKYQPQIKHVGTLPMSGIGEINEVYGSLINETIFPEGGSSANLNFIVWLKNGVPYYLSMSGHQNNNLYYTQKQPDNALDTSKAFFDRYKTYLTNYCNVDASYLQPMIDMLNNVTQLSSNTVSSGNILMKISGDPSWRQLISAGSSTYVNFDYFENGVDVSRKHVSLDYYNGTLQHFQDTWNLYNVGAWSQISKEEAINIASTAAQKYVSDEENKFGTKPDLSDVTYKATLSMVPRENNVLYPSWEVIIFYNKPTSNVIGIQVIIRGDTKEVTYTESYLVLGSTNGDSSTPKSSQSIASPAPTSTTPISTTKTTATLFTTSSQAAPFIAVGIIITAIAIFLSLYIRHRKATNQA